MTFLSDPASLGKEQLFLWGSPGIVVTTREAVRDEVGCLGCAVHLGLLGLLQEEVVITPIPWDNSPKSWAHGG